MNSTHGLSGSVEHVIWASAKGRCFNPNNHAFADYGGRGITMCKEWHDDFAAFLRAMGPRPSPTHSLDRIDHNGPYSPENCRWTDWLTQQRNRRSNARYTYDGHTRTLAEWAQLTGIKSATLSYRLRKGWPLADAFRRGQWPLDKPHVTAARHRWALK